MVNMPYEYPTSPPYTLGFPKNSFSSTSLNRHRSSSISSTQFMVAAGPMCAQKTPPPTPLGTRKPMAIRLVSPPPPPQSPTMKAEHHHSPGGTMSESISYRQQSLPSASPIVSAKSSSSSTPSQTPARPPFVIHNASFPLPSLPPHFAPGGARRQSRFDPMGREEEEEDSYGELGHRHPLRRIQEDPSKEHHEVISLPGIKALFGAADNSNNNHPPTPSTSGSLFQSPSLPSLSGSGSPSSSARTSRYSSFASSNAVADQPGWWAPGGEKHHSYHQPSSRNNSIHPYMLDDEHDQKRRRSDQTPMLRDPEESARLRRQAQNRNASFPNSNPGLRGIYNSLPSPLDMTGGPLSISARPSISGLPMSSPLGIENGGRVMFDRRESGMSRRDSSMSTMSNFSRRESMQSRNSSFAGPLTRSFADLSASDRASPTMDSPSSNVPSCSAPSPMPQEKSRISVLAGAATDSVPVPREGFEDSTTRSIGMGSLGRRMSLTRPPSPENPIKSIRRSSLTELIMVKTGDDVTIARGGGFYAEPGSSGSTPTNAPAKSASINTLTSSVAAAHQALSAVSEPTPSWSRRESNDSVASAPGVSLNSDNEGASGSTSGTTKRRYDPRDPFTAGMNSTSGGMEENEAESMRYDPGMRGMEVLAIVADAERNTSGPVSVRNNNVETDREDREQSPSKGTGGSAGPKYTCAYCAKTFSRPSSLRIHTYSHTGERPFICPEPTCRRRFSVQSNLKRHAKVHQLGGGGASTQGNGTYTPPTHLGPLMIPTRGINGGPPPPGSAPPSAGGPGGAGGPVMHPPPMIFGYPPPHPHSHPAGVYPPGPLPPPGFLAHPQPLPPGYDNGPHPSHSQPHPHPHSHQPHFAVALRMSPQQPFPPPPPPPPPPPGSEHMEAHYRGLQRRRSMEQEREREERENREVQRRASGGMIEAPGMRHWPLGGGGQRRGSWSDEEDEIEEDELDEDDLIGSAAPSSAKAHHRGGPIKQEVKV